jgi:MFS family permease
LNTQRKLRSRVRRFRLTQSMGGFGIPSRSHHQAVGENPDSGPRQLFNRFWLGYSVSQFGDRISELALPLIAIGVLHSSAGQTALVVALIWLPNVASPVIGTWADTLRNKRRLMVGADLLRFAALFSLPVVYLLGEVAIWQLYAVAVLTGLGQTVFDVLYPAFFVSLVPWDSYVAANSKLNTSRSASFVLGPAAGGALIQVLSAPVAVLVDALSFIYSAAVVGRLKVVDAAPAQDSASSLRVRLSAGLRFILGHPVIRASLACSTTVNFFMFVAQALVLLFANRSLGLSAGVIGVSMGVGAVGGLLGAVLANRMVEVIGLGRTIVLGAIAYPAPVALLVLAHGPHLASAILLGATEWLSGMGVMMFDIANNSLKTALIPDDLRSRTAGAYNAVNYGVRPLGALTGGWLATALGLRPTLAIAAVGGVLGCLFLLTSPIPGVAKVPRPDKFG